MARRRKTPSHHNLIGKERSVLSSLAVRPRLRLTFNERKSLRMGFPSAVERLIALGQVVEADGALSLTEEGRARFEHPSKWKDPRSRAAAALEPT